MKLLMFGRGGEAGELPGTCSRGLRKFWWIEEIERAHIEYHGINRIATQK